MAGEGEDAEITGSKPNSPRPERPAVVRLPAFIDDADVGLGDLVKHVTSAAGIKPCQGCNKRAATLNRWVVFRGSKRG